MPSVVESASSVSNAVPAHGLCLPPDNAAENVDGQGWLVRTEVKQSAIPGAGMGRFAIEPIKAGTRVMVKRITMWKDVRSLAELPPDGAIHFTNAGEIEEYITMSMAEGGHSREAVLDMLAHFIYAYPETNDAALNVCTFSMNHGIRTRAGEKGGPNLLLSEIPDPDAIGRRITVFTAIIDIAAGEELLNDYQYFAMPPFWLEYCAAHKLVDSRSRVRDALGGEL